MLSLAGIAVGLYAPFHLGLSTGQPSMIYAALSGVALLTLESGATVGPRSL